MGTAKDIKWPFNPGDIVQIKFNGEAEEVQGHSVFLIRVFNEQNEYTIYCSELDAKSDILHYRQINREDGTSTIFVFQDHIDGYMFLCKYSVPEV